MLCKKRSTHIGVVSIQAVGQLEDRTADKMCDNAAKVQYSNDDTQAHVRESKYFYDKSERKCCTLSLSSGRFANTGSVCI